MLLVKEPALSRPKKLQVEQAARSVWSSEVGICRKGSLLARTYYYIGIAIIGIAFSAKSFLPNRQHSKFTLHEV